MKAPTTSDIKFPGTRVQDNTQTPPVVYETTGAGLWNIVPGTGVSSVTGTANEITASPTTGAVVLSIPSTFVAPGSIAATSTVTGGTGLVATTGNLTLSAVGSGFITTPTIGTTGATPITANGRIVSATFSSVSIAAAATQALVITNSSVTSSSQIGLVSWSGATTGAALTLQSVVNATGSTTFTFTNGTGASTSTANITITYELLN